MTEPIGLDPRDLDDLQSAQAEIERKLMRLRSLEPRLLDLSLREPVTGSPIGHSLDDKRSLFALTGSLGLADRVIAALSAEETVDDRFLQAFRAEQADLTGCFVFVLPGRVDDGGFAPDASMTKQAAFGAPNAVFHVDVSAPRRARKGLERSTLLDGVAQSVAWMRARLPGPGPGIGQVYVNLSDLMDAFRDEPDFACMMVKLLASLEIDGLMYEDPRGTCFPFQHGAVTRWLRRYLPPPTRLLVHPHAGNGLEHASVIESVLAGGDGAWLGFTSHAATNGHASGLAFLTNLLRAGNPRVPDVFDVAGFVPAADRMAEIHNGAPLSAQEPVAGPWAYREVLDNFSQENGYPGDLPAAQVGARRGWRIVPAIAAPRIIAARLRETGIVPNAAPDDALVEAMATLMRESLLAGEKIAYDEPAALTDLTDRARSRLAAAEETESAAAANDSIER